MATYLTVFVLVFPLSVYSAETSQLFEAGENDKQILDKLLNTTRYDKRSRPEDQTKIQIMVLLHSLSSPDESSLNYEVEFLQYRKWEDGRLRFDDGGRHRYLNGMTHVDRVWLPDTYIVKHGSLKEPLVDMSLRIHPNGTVLHIMRKAISINCQGNLKIFPFDNPKCPFAVESVSLEKDELQLAWAKSSPLTAASSLQSFNAYLIHSEIGECGEMFTWRGNFSCLHILLVFTRDKNFYFSTVFVPGMILVASAFISFWLDKEMVPARVMIGVTTMLSFCTTTNNFRSSLPVVSNLTAMNLWDAVCMFLIYSSLLEFVFVNYLHRKPHHEEGAARPCKKCTKVGSLQTTPDSEGERVQNGAAEPKVEPRFAWIRLGPSACEGGMSPKELSHRIENTAKLVFPSLFTLFVVVYFIVFAAVLPYSRDNWVIQPPEYSQSLKSKLT